MVGEWAGKEMTVATQNSDQLVGVVGALSASQNNGLMTRLHQPQLSKLLDSTGMQIEQRETVNCTFDSNARMPRGKAQNDEGREGESNAVHGLTIYQFKLRINQTELNRGQGQNS